MTPIEKVARAMCGHVDPDECEVYRMHPSGIELDEGEPFWKGYVEQAQDAMRAARDAISDAMVEAWADAGPSEPLAALDSDANRACATADWRAMIDAMLTEGF